MEENMLLSTARDKKPCRQDPKLFLASLPAYLHLWQFKSHLLSIAKNKSYFPLLSTNPVKSLGVTCVICYHPQHGEVSHTHAVWGTERYLHSPFVTWDRVLGIDLQGVFVFFQICLLLRGLWEIGLQESVHSSYAEVFLLGGAFHSHATGCAPVPWTIHSSWAALRWDCMWASPQLTQGCFHILSHDRTCICTSSLVTEEGPWHVNFKLLHEWHGLASPGDTIVVALRKDDTSSHPRVNA